MLIFLSGQELMFENVVNEIYQRGIISADILKIKFFTFVLADTVIQLPLQKFESGLV